MAALAAAGFEDVRVTARFACFGGTTKEKTARKYGVQGGTSTPFEQEVSMNRRLAWIAGIAAIVLLTSQPAGQAQQAQPAEKPLYERLGGVYAIATVVDDFIERLLVNDTLNANAAIKASRDRVPRAGLKYRVTELVCQVTGGPCKYTGRGMKEAHAHLKITEREWQAMVAEFKITLDTFKVPAKEQQELFDIVATTKKEIVVAAGTK